MVIPRSTGNGGWYIDSGNYECWHGSIDGRYCFVSRAPYSRTWRASVELDSDAALIGYGRSAVAALADALSLTAMFKPRRPGIYEE